MTPPRSVARRLGRDDLERLAPGAKADIIVVDLLRLDYGAVHDPIKAGCALFGLEVGNLTTLPGLVLAVEWPRERFSTLVGLAVGINQLTFAFGPSLVGVLRDWSGEYGAALGACMVLRRSRRF